MVILTSMGDVGETLLTTLATAAVENTAESIIEVDVNARQALGSEDPFYSYLRDIRELGLLTPDEEIDATSCQFIRLPTCIRKE